MEYDNEFVDDAVDHIVEEIERRNEYNVAMRQLRDASDPFLLPNELIRKVYRLDRDVARYVFGAIEDALPGGVRSTKTPRVLQFFSALHFFAQGSYQKSVGKDVLCPMSQSAVSRSLHNVVRAIVVRLNGHIRYPQTDENIRTVKNGFFEKFGLPGVCGAVDGTHVAVVPPAMGNLAYPRLVFLNRKNFFSINCQIICDSGLKILSINARYPGSVHDAAIWRMSDVNFLVRRKYRDGQRNCWLLGDSAYPLRPYLLTPIANAVPGSPESRYNHAHAVARNVVERCIGVLKGRFRCLRQDRVLHYKPDFASRIIYACSILHNIMKDANIDDDEIALDDENEDEEDEEIEDQPDDLQRGHETRQQLVQNLFR